MREVLVEMRHRHTQSGHVHSTLPQVVPEIDANPVKVCGEEDRGWSRASLQNTENRPKANLLLPLGVLKFCASHLCPAHIFQPGDAPKSNTVMNGSSHAVSEELPNC